MPLKTTAAIVAVLLVLASIMLVRGNGPEPRTARPLDATQFGSLSLDPCTIRLGSQDLTADCGQLIVPENWNDQGSRRITLPITRIRSLSPTPSEPVFYLEGGPGMSNMKARPPVGLLENHDFVMVGYRGVDGSVRLDCPEVVAALKGDGRDLLSERSRKGLSSAMRTCAARLSGRSIDLDRYTIPDVIADMEAARHALGYRQINLYSRSYGTRIAQIYATQYPEAIRRSLMVGANPPGRFVWDPEMIDAQIRQLAKWRAKAKDGNDLVRVMHDVSRAMPSRWLGIRIDPGKVKAVSFALLFNTGTAALVSDAWEAADRGDASGLALMSLAYDFVLPKMFVYGDFFAKGFSADLEPARDYVTTLNPPDAVIGSPLSTLFFGAALGCDGPCWPTARLPEDLPAAPASPVETLILSGDLDFSTPAQYAARELLPKLPNGRQIVLSNMGHVDDLTGAQPKAFARLATSFFDRGEVDVSKFTGQAMTSRVRWGFPVVAKALVAGGAILAFAAFGILALMLRKLWEM